MTPWLNPGLSRRRLLVQLAGGAVVTKGTAARAGSTAEELRKLIDPSRVPLEPDVRQLGNRTQRVVIRSAPGVQCAFLVQLPSEGSGPFPVVVLLHGTRGRKEGMAPWATELVKRGIAAVSTDARYHGELATEEYEQAIIRAYRTRKGHPWLYETVADTLRVTDYLETRPDLDARRVGMLGISMGGMNTWLTAAVDPRVKVAVPCIGVTSFGYQLRTGQFKARTDTLARFHQAVADDLGRPSVDADVVRAAWDRLLPGILDRFDCPSLLPLIAPRPLLILNGEDDARCPIEGVRLCHAAALPAYRAVGAAARLRLHVAARTGHQVTEEQKQLALGWFSQHL